MKKTVDKKLFSALKRVTEKEKEFWFPVTVVKDLAVTLGLISAKEDNAALLYAKETQSTESGLDEAYQLELFIWSIKQINGEDVDQYALVEQEDEKGEKELIEVHRYLRELILTTWSRDTVGSLRGILNLKRAQWMTDSASGIKTEEGLNVLELMREMSKKIPQDLNSLIKTSEGEKSSEETEKSEPPKQEFKDVKIEPKTSGILEDAYETGAVKPRTLQDIPPDQMNKNQPITQLDMMEGNRTPADRIASPGHEIGAAQDDKSFEGTIPPYHGVSGVPTNPMPRRPAETILDLNQVKQAVSPIQKFRMDRNKLEKRGS